MTAVVVRDGSRPERDRQDAGRERGGGRRNPDAGAASVGATTARDGHSASGDDRAPRPSGTAPAAKASFTMPTGAEIDAYGDSIMVGSLQALRYYFPGIRIDAKSNRRWSDGLSEVAARGVGNRRAVILAFGTNAGVDEDAVKKVLDTLGPDRMVVLVNIMAPFARVDTDNATLELVARGRPNVVVADWADAIRAHPDQVQSDRIHPTITGAHLFSKTVRQAMADLSARNTGKTVVLKDLPIPVSAVAGVADRQPATTGSPTRMVAPAASGSTGVSRMPNHVAPSHFRCRARVRIGSLPERRSTRSIVVMTQRSHTIVVRNGTSPMRTDDQASSANGSPPATTTLGRNRRAPRDPGLLTPLEGRLEHPVVEARQRRLRRDVDRRGVRQRVAVTLGAAQVGPDRAVRLVVLPHEPQRTPDPFGQPRSALGTGGSSAVLPREADRHRRGVAGRPRRRAGPRPAASSRTPPPSSGSARSPSRACSSRAVTLVPSGSTTAHRRSPRSPRASTTAASTLTPPSDLTGYAVSDVTRTCSVGATLGHWANHAAYASKV